MLQVKKQIELALERTQQIAQKQALKRESATQSLELARREKDLLTNERKAAHAQAKRLEEERQGLLAQIEQLKIEHVRPRVRRTARSSLPQPRLMQRVLVVPIPCLST